MNWRVGLFRLWVVGSAIWVVGVSYLAFVVDQMAAVTFFLASFYMLGPPVGVLLLLGSPTRSIIAGAGCLGVVAVTALLLYGLAVIIFREAFFVSLPNPFDWF